MNFQEYLADCAGRYDDNNCMLGEKWVTRTCHTKIKGGEWVHTTKNSMEYALCLFKAGQTEQMRRACDIVGKVLTLQDIDPVNKTFGLWPWLLEEPLEEMSSPDWNWADFIGVRIAHMLGSYQQYIPKKLQADMKDALSRAAWCIFRRNVGVGYTNIVVMGSVTTAMAGELLDDKRLLEYSISRLNHLLDDAELHGWFDEYNSPTYTMIALHECERAIEILKNETVRNLFEKVRYLAWKMIADHFHPGTGQWSGPHCRAYANLLFPGTVDYLSRQTGTNILCHPEMQKKGLRADLCTLHMAINPLPCPGELRERFKALPVSPTQIVYRLRAETDEKAARIGTSWFDDNATLGSVNFEYTGDQPHNLMGYWRTEQTPAVVLRFRVLHDGFDFCSGFVRHAQDGSRVLTTLNFVTDRGDRHINNDHPIDDLFNISDLRISYELTGPEVRSFRENENLFGLSAGNYNALVHTCPGEFAGNKIYWEINQSEKKASVDAVFYQGPARKFNFTEINSVVFATGLELIPVNQPPVEESPAVKQLDNNCYEAEWKLENILRVYTPNKPMKFFEHAKIV